MSKFFSITHSVVVYCCLAVFIVHGFQKITGGDAQISEEMLKAFADSGIELPPGMMPAGIAQSDSEAAERKKKEEEERKKKEEEEERKKKEEEEERKKKEEEESKKKEEEERKKKEEEERKKKEEEESKKKEEEEESKKKEETTPVDLPAEVVKQESTPEVQEVKKEEAVLEVPEVTESVDTSEAPLQESATGDTPVASEEIVPTDEAAKESGGIDTIDVADPSGNWLLKRVWYEKATALSDKIKNRVEEIADARMDFFTQRDSLEHDVFDPFFTSVGFDQGQLVALLDNFVAEIEKIQKKDGVLSFKEREFLDKIGTEKSVLDQLRSDLKAVDELDDALDDALRQLMEQVNLSRKYEKSAWANFKEITIVLSDKKAQNLYHQMNTHLRNISDILSYIKQEFTNHFNKIAQKSRDQIQRIQDSMAALKEKGIDFKTTFEQLQEAHETELVDTDEDDQQDDIGWFASIKQGMGSVYTWVTSWFA